MRHKAVGRCDYVNSADMWWTATETGGVPAYRTASSPGAATALLNKPVGSPLPTSIMINLATSQTTLYKNSRERDSSTSAEALRYRVQ